MIEERTPELPFEPERYELYDGSAYRFELARREFFKVLGGGIVVIFAVKEAFGEQESGRGGRRGFAESMPPDLGAWLHIADDGTVTVYTGKAEVGQNIRTSLTQAVAEELRAPLDSIRMVMADTDLTPFDQGTFGSRTTPIMSPQLRKAAASARELLIDLAAERWNVDPADLVVAEGQVTDPRANQSFSFGQLTKGRKLMRTIGETVLTTPADRWVSVPELRSADRSV